MATVSRMLLAGTLIALAALFAAPVADARHDRRKVYLFTLDGMDRQALDSAPFISTLIDGENGATTTWFRRSRSVMVSETNPNHTSMITGAFPRTHGITGNEFGIYGDPPSEDSCRTPIDVTMPPTAISGENSNCVEVENLFAAIERQRNAAHITAAGIFGKPKLARLFASKRIHGPGGRYDADYLWAPCDEGEDYCEDVATNPATGYAASDSIVMDEVIRTTREKVLDRGKLRRPDFTFVNFPQIDSAGHGFGRESGPYMTAVALVDAEVQRFVDNQKELGLWSRTVLILISDHGMDTTPIVTKVSLNDRLDAAGIPSSRYLIVGNGSAAHIYLTDRRQPGRNILLARMREAIQGSGIDDVLYRRPNQHDGGRAHTLRHRRPDWGLARRRAGDLVVTTKPGVGVFDTSDASSFPINPLLGNHGGTQTRNNILIVSGGSEVLNQGTSDRGVSSANAAATAARLLVTRRPRDAEANWVADGAFSVPGLRFRQALRAPR